ncbi:hypothetical protein [Streptomyces sp. S.PB5]|uniref:hypothetical protein n=1 Tax=Streptomyces sp. S.PB5 TaxID=3020844 RepID=UPI0025AFA3AA|nr:hypothetical protein [Streptomyces sp. S.PB5]MDN3028196.1 hypothetical protein [Streptomyces sp. S.PB5]
MLHEVEDIEQEKVRLTLRPPVHDAPPVLCAFDVVTNSPVEEYSRRLRSVLSAALDLAVSASFDDDDLPVDTVPGWFAAAGSGLAGAVPDFARRGADRYAAAVKGGPWDLQEWLFQFDPDSEFRGWAWWDLTQASEDRVRIWVDTWGESFFACDELRWVAYISGGDEVAGPTVVRTADWVAAIAS